MASALGPHTDPFTSSAPASAASALRYPPETFTEWLANGAAGPAAAGLTALATPPKATVTVAIEGQRIEVMATPTGGAPTPSGGTHETAGTEAPATLTKVGKEMANLRRFANGCKKHWKTIAMVAFILVVAALATCVATGQFGDSGQGGGVPNNYVIAGGVVAGGALMGYGAYALNKRYGCKPARPANPERSATHENIEPFISADISK